ncbi:MAG: hypothetical protein ABI442_16230 [Gemmatimonadaceae bacterium]
MIDFLYIAGTIVFFGLMLLYVHACDRLGRTSSADGGASENSEQ